MGGGKKFCMTSSKKQRWPTHWESLRYSPRQIYENNKNERRKGEWKKELGVRYWKSWHEGGCPELNRKKKGKRVAAPKGFQEEVILAVGQWGAKKQGGKAPVEDSTRNRSMEQL